MTFSVAALGRLVECCAYEGRLDPAPTETDRAVVTLHRLVADSIGRGLTAGLEEIAEGDELFWGPAAAGRVLTITGLMELALSVGYLDLSDGIEPSLVKEIDRALASFDVKVVGPTSSDPIIDPRVELFRRLRNRLSAPSFEPADRNDRLIGVFDSYVDLTSQVWADRPLHQFLIDTHSTMEAEVRDEDRAFLLSPHHFASALATGRVGEKNWNAIPGGLSALRRLDWLCELVRAAGDGQLGNDVVRHARWSHSVDRVVRRLDLWSSAMAEWAVEERDREGEAAWIDYTARVFDPLKAAQLRLEVAPLVPTNYWDVSLPSTARERLSPGDVQERVDTLMAQGQLGAARRAASDAVATHHALLVRTTAAEWVEWVPPLVKICTILALLGDVDTAAAYVAPVRARLSRTEGATTFLLEEADSILRQAKLPTPITTTEISPPPVVPGATTSQTRTRNRAMRTRTAGR